MPIKFIFKATTLLLALGITIYSIYLLNQGHLTDFMGSLSGGHYSQSFSWCSNRVTKITGDLNGTLWTLEEKDKKWFIRKEEGAFELDYLSVEKWFGEYCQLKIDLVKSDSLLQKPLVLFAKATMNDGQVANIYRLDDLTFQINEVSFQSEEMKEAIESLKDLLKI